jgi:hypothetical protein
MTYEQQLENIRQWAKDIAASIVENGDAEALIAALVLKRHYDGMNGRTWDASEHLRHEREASRILSHYIELPDA